MDELKQRQNEEAIYRRIAKEMNLSPKQVERTAVLLNDGNTIPFIARYRKEWTGELDENQIHEISERLKYARHLEERKAEVIRLIDEQGKLTDELRRAVEKAEKLQEVEDLYLPFRPKRKTRASVAKEKGLEPLAQWILSLPKSGSVMEQSARFVSEEKGVHTPEEALAGALDIIAEQVAEDADVRAWVRNYTKKHGILRSEAKDPEKTSVYEMYYAYQEPLRTLPPHRVLAINRGEKEGILKVSLEVPTEPIFEYINRKYNDASSVVSPHLQNAIEDAYKRLLAPSIERDIRGEWTERAEKHAVEIFAANLRQLLLAPPVKGKTVLGVDPAYRTGCKLAVVDETGKLLETAVIYPTPPHQQVKEAMEVCRRLVEQYQVDVIAIGNGTASRETEQFVADFIKSVPRKLSYVIVNEAGASVYSASKLAQEEFPHLDVAERSAVSIARRLQDPLAELVKIDPKSIGIGQYQHDVSPKFLAESLQFVVESAVNHVGVDLNTASPSLLSYVSGINASIAKSIVQYREEHGKFTSREQLRLVPRLGPKTFEQCASFLRIPDSDFPLDNTSIHPESYPIAQKLLDELGFDLKQLGDAKLKEKLEAIDPEQWAERLGTGVPTLKDIIANMQKPGRDPREDLPPPIFRSDVVKMEDLKPGMELKGTVRNVTDFGAFVDIGLKNDGLVHISQLSERYVKHPLDVVAVGDIVTVWVLNVDQRRERVSLTMIKP